MQARVNDLLSQTMEGLENDSRARQYLLEFSSKLERLENGLEAADANWDNDGAYGQSVKTSCLETRRLFVINGQAQRSAGESAIGGIRPDNPIFADSRIDVKDVRDTIFCSQYERSIRNSSFLSWTKWNSSYLADTQRIAASLEFNGDHGSYQTSGFRGELKDVIYFDDQISGRWEVGGDSGWFEFPLRGSSFSGFWGHGELGSPLGGEWSGNRF
jgi:hypothetical protein